MPDLNSLPPSPAPAGSQVRPNGGGPEGPQRTPSSSSPRSTSVSLAAAASINAGIQHQDSRRSSTSSNRNRTSQAPGRNELSRSNVPTNLNLYDPTLPAPGELQTGDLSGSTSQPRRSTSPYSLYRQHFPSKTVGVHLAWASSIRSWSRNRKLRWYAAIKPRN